MATRQLRLVHIDGNVAYVPLTRGLEAVIDACDLPLVAGHNWHVVNGWNGTVYAGRHFKSAEQEPRGLICMHRVLMGMPEGIHVDHVDGDGLNNRRSSNLRLATKAQNGCNRAAASHNTSGFKGVSFCRSTGRWRAEIRFDGTRVRIGRFDTPEEAAVAYANEAAKLHGVFARTS